jgi:hypothetical protein
MRQRFGASLAFSTLLLAAGRSIKSAHDLRCKYLFVRGLLILFAVYTLTAVEPGPGAAIPMQEAALRSAVLGGGRITFRTNGVIYLTNSIRIKTDTVIDAGELDVTIDGSGSTRLFSIENARVTLRGLALNNARFQAGPGVIDPDPSVFTVAETAFGGAISCSNANVSIQSCIFSNNIAPGGPTSR